MNVYDENFEKTDEGSLGEIFSSADSLGAVFASADLSTTDNCCCGCPDKDTAAADLAKNQCPYLTSKRRPNTP